MYQAFRTYIAQNKLISTGDRILLATSGGIDSVALWKLVEESGIDYAIAHCNFNLRGKESDEDEAFVRNLADKAGVQFHCKSFDTLHFAQQNRISIQMAARELRYVWFNGLIAVEGYNSVATAHHLDDQAETFFINLLRGTGLSGLHGILPRQGNIIRPLLFATRDEITAFVRQQNLQWREDSSNADGKYLRNRLRLELMPVLRNIQPDFSKKLNETIRIIRDTETVFRQKIEEGKVDLVDTKGDEVRILISWLEEFYPLETWLYELLKPFSFTYSQVRDIGQSVFSGSGKLFDSPTHRLIRDRDYLIVAPIRSTAMPPDEPILAFSPGLTSQPQVPVPLTFRIEDADKVSIPSNPNIACFDFERLQFPLYLRKWVKGDFFYPFGGKGKKKLSDFFIDQKIPVHQKNSVYLLTSGDDIIWIPGMRADNRYKVTNLTKKVLLVHLAATDTTPENAGWSREIF